MTDIRNIIANEILNELIYQKNYKGNKEPKICMNRKTAFWLDAMVNFGVDLSTVVERELSYTYMGVPIEVDDDMPTCTFEIR